MSTISAIAPAEASRILNERLDLTPMRLKLADPEEGKGWNSAQLDVVETAYRQSLALKMAYPDEDVVPTKAIDEFWHVHILDTAKYDVDCQVLFGCRLDHFPYFGIEGMGEENSPRALERAFARTLALWDEHFGAQPPGPADAAVARCRTACKPQKCK